MSDTFHNIRPNGLATVADSTSRLAFLPPNDGYTVVELDTHALWIWNATTQTWVAGGGGGVSTYANLAAFPVTAADGTLAIALDTHILYEYETGTGWVPIASPGTPIGIGTFDSGTPSANGAHIDTNQLIMPSASTSNPGLVNTSAQSFLGQKTFSTGLTGTLTGSASLNVLTSALGNLTDAGTDGITVTGGTGATVGTVSIAQHVADTTHNGYLSSTDWNTFNNKQAALTIGNLTDSGTDGITITGGTGSIIGTGTSISQHVADTTHNGYLNSTDWNTFNGKQAAGNYITALTGDGTATGPGSAVFTLATVNTNVGSFGDATDVSTFTVNGKGLITAASSTPIQITESQVTNLVTDLASKAPLASPTFTGTVTTPNLTISTFTPGSIPFAGAGGALMQDNANLFWDDTNKRFSIAGHLDTATLGLVASGSTVGLDITSTSSANAFQVENQGGVYCVSVTNATNSATQGAAIGGAFSRGTNTARTAVQAGDYVTTFTGQSYNGSSFGPGYNGAIVIAATENQTSSRNGGQMGFATTPNGSLAPVTALILGQDQTVQLPHYTTNGFVKFTGTSGLLAVDTNTYVTSVTGDIVPTTWSGLANNASGQTVTGLAFATTVSSFEVLMNVQIVATSNTYTTVKILGTRRAASDWSVASIQVEDVGDAITGLAFDISSAGQVTMTIGNIAGFTSGSVKFRAQVLS